MAGEFEIKDLGELKYFLGKRITCSTNDGISLNPSGYIHQVLERYGISDSKLVFTMLVPGAHLIKVTEAGHGDADLKLYQGMVGSIMYAMLCTCSDLAFPIQQLSQFNSNPPNAHFQCEGVCVGRWEIDGWR